VKERWKGIKDDDEEEVVGSRRMMDGEGKGEGKRIEEESKERRHGRKQNGFVLYDNSVPKVQYDRVNFLQCSAVQCSTARHEYVPVVI
jgi:hypothetical protein